MMWKNKQAKIVEIAPHIDNFSKKGDPPPAHYSRSQPPASFFPSNIFQCILTLWIPFTYFCQQSHDIGTCLGAPPTTLNLFIHFLINQAVFLGWQTVNTHKLFSALIWSHHWRDEVWNEDSTQNWCCYFGYKSDNLFFCHWFECFIQ